MGTIVKVPAGNGKLSLVWNKENLSGLLKREDFMESLRSVCTKYLTAERAIKIGLLAASRQPKLWQCTVASFLQSMIRAAELGLEFGGSTGHGFLVPYRNGYLSRKAGRDVYEAQFIPGYRGFIELAYRSGKVAFIDVQLVYEQDEFQYGYEYGTAKSPFIHHKPLLTGDRGNLMCAYSVIMLKDSPIPKIDYMTAAELDCIRECSKSKDDGPWKTFPGEMQKKSIIRRSFKWIPTTPELALAEESDNVDFDLSRSASEIAVPQQLGTAGTRNRMLAAMTQAPEPGAVSDADYDSESAEGLTGEPPQFDLAAGVDETGEPPQEQPTLQPAGYQCDSGHEFSEPRMVGKRAHCPECQSTRIQQIMVPTQQ
jgi:phage RecT family recombinase